MPNKVVLPIEQKVRIVKKYLNGELGATAIKEQYGIGWTTLRAWVQRYELRGATGFEQTSRNRKYGSDVKQAAVQEYLRGEGSLKEICKRYDVSDAKSLRQWIKWYNGHGDFKQPNNGGAIYMAKGRKTTMEERIKIVSHCILNNKDYGKTIEKYGVSYQQIYNWVRKYEKDGLDSLADRRGKRRDETSMTEVEKLRAQLKLKEAENLRLQMENDLLKKLEALERGMDVH